MKASLLEFQKSLHKYTMEISESAITVKKKNIEGV